MSEEFASIILEDPEDPFDESIEAIMARKDEYIDWLQTVLIEVSRSIRDFINELEGDDYGPYVSKATILQRLEEIWEQT